MKLVSCLRGAVWDVAVDLRKGSSTFLHWHAAKLSSSNMYMMVIPEGFAHGFIVTSKEAEVCYKTTNFYMPRNERCIIFNDPSLKIEWPKLECDFILNNKDLKGAFFVDSK